MNTTVTDFVLTVLLAGGILTGCNTPGKEASIPGYIDPDIGGVGHLLQPTRPTVSLPNRMIRMYPVRPDYLSDQISFFPLTIKSHRKGELFGIMPYAGTSEDSTWTRKQMFDHDLEITHPWYYSTCFVDSNIQTAFTPGARTGIFRFTYSRQQPKVIRLQINNEGKWQSLSDHALNGEEWFPGMKAYVYGEFNVKGTFYLTHMKVTVRRKINRQVPVILFELAENTPGTIYFKYGISFISPEQARKNLQEEIPEWNFDALETRAKSKWQKKLGKIEVKGGTESQRRVFYTALYRCYERMVNIAEDGRYYSAYDHRVHETSRGFYVDDWVWDTYLALHPLRMILDPGMETDMLRSYISMYEQSGSMPQFPLLYRDDPAMHGFHSTIVFLDAWRKGIRDFDMEKAYEGMRKNATEATMLPWRNGPMTRLDTFYREHGFFPALNPGEKETVKEVHPFERRQAVAVTLAHSYDDWALAEMAKELGKKDDFQYFIHQSLNYRNLYKPDMKLFIPKDAKGQWIDIDPKFDGGPGGRDYYDENNAYTYAWQGQHDIQGLIKLKGGCEAFTRELDHLFREDLGRSKYKFWAKFPDATGLVGQFSMGNEPGFHIPYLYNYSGAPWKTQKHIRFLLNTWFMDNIFGIPGDEDGGGMSAFVVFSSMGFYPVTPGLPVYNIGSPVFKEVKIHLPKGKTFTIIAHHYAKENKYIQSAKLNGKPLEHPWFTHNDILKGSTLELEMGPYPNKQWGSSPDAAPPSSVDITNLSGK
ncbi:MAG: glycoside hydrolase family 92 protein [Chlorobi bacterium]|nr:glycoside hydrolase family 92 protein [Chlorobiota bacterium]